MIGGWCFIQMIHITLFTGFASSLVRSLRRNPTCFMRVGRVCLLTNGMCIHIFTLFIVFLLDSPYLIFPSRPAFSTPHDKKKSFPQHPPLPQRAHQIPLLYHHPHPHRSSPECPLHLPQPAKQSST